MRQFIAGQDWLTVHQLPSCAPDLNPVEGIWSLLRHGGSPTQRSRPRHPGTWSDPLGLYGCELEDLGGGWYRPPEGLDYGPGSAEGYRITHVMQHTRDNPAKPAHGVFDTGNQGVLETVDEAWSRRAAAVSVNQQGARTTYIIPMARQVGYNPGEEYISITVEHGNEVIRPFRGVGTDRKGCLRPPGRRSREGLGDHHSVCDEGGIRRRPSPVGAHRSRLRSVQPIVAATPLLTCDVPKYRLCLRCRPCGW